jgi:uncharacterized protein YecT (DUF1311 family)
MSASSRLSALAIAAGLLAPPGANAMDETLRASSRGPTLLGLCGEDGIIDAAGCNGRPYGALADKMEAALQAKLAKAPANLRPLLKRDQAWFDEIIINAAESMKSDKAGGDALVAMLRQRAATLETIGPGFGRSGFAGRWVSAFGSATVTPADQGAYRLAIDLHATYGADENQILDCHTTTLLAPAAGGWLAGTIPGEDKSADDNASTNDTKSAPIRPTIKMRRQGETLRIVANFGDDTERTNCRNIGQITASYFASGKPDGHTSADKADTSFVTPTFDCKRPDTASDEEICADPDLAENDQRLNRARKALLPRLDDATRRALTEDQRNWINAQTSQYRESLHPGRDKTSWFMHFTVDARHEFDRLQRERIALLEGFDDKRSGLEGLWLSHTAVLKVTSTADGGIEAKGSKWDREDWKTVCDFDIKGKIAGGVFRSDETRTNPDTLERDHATLIVNRQDDAFAKKRYQPEAESSNDEAKCTRNLSNSSTARLFPVRPSPDFDNLLESTR